MGCDESFITTKLCFETDLIILLKVLQWTRNAVTSATSPGRPAPFDARGAVRRGLIGRIAHY
jgi:hypothetical protein